MWIYLQLVARGNPGERFSEIVTVGIYTWLGGEPGGIFGNLENISGIIRHWVNNW